MSPIKQSSPDPYAGGVNINQAINPEHAMFLGRDVLDLSTLQPNAFFNPPLTDELASQPKFSQIIKKAWLSQTDTKATGILLDPNLEQTQRLLEHADMLDEEYGMKTGDRYVLVFRPRAVFLPRPDFGIVSVYSGLLGNTTLASHDMDDATVLDETEITAGDIAIDYGEFTHSIANLSTTANQLMLVQTLPRNMFRVPQVASDTFRGL